MSLGERLKAIRERRGLSQNELSRRSGVRQALISELEAGKKMDTTGLALVRLARVLAVSVDYLLGTFDPDSERLATEFALAEQPA
jgi:transcriptional regulator with XRE-family HTH domain